MGKKRAPVPKQKIEEKDQWEDEEEQENQQEDPSIGEKAEKEEKFSLYKLLNLENGVKSTPEQIKKQYRSMALMYHPDKNIGDETAKQKFQKVKEAYDILSNPEKKKVYDETGIIGDDMDERAFETAYEYFRSMSKRIQLSEIMEFEKNYRGGLEEEEDLLNFYQDYGGNMISLLECIPCSRNQDIPRFIKFYQQKISEKKIVLTKDKIFEKTKVRVRKLVDESKEAEEMQKEMEKKQQKKKSSQGMSDLILAIRNKPKASFLDSLEQKYCPKPKKTKVQKEKQSKPARRTNKKI